MNIKALGDSENHLIADISILDATLKKNGAHNIMYVKQQTRN